MVAPKPNEQSPTEQSPNPFINFINLINNLDSDSDSDNWFKSYQNWEKETKTIHTTIQTILDIPIGESRIFLCLDRNVLDFAGDSLSECYETETEVLPSFIFSGNYHIKYTKTGEGLTGTFIIANSLDEIDELDDSPRTDFDIEYSTDKWYPMQNGSLPASDSQGFSALFGTEKHWSTFDVSTRLGWRGPMIPIERIDEIPIKFV